MLDRFRLDDRVSIVTGASSGLGAAAAVGLAEVGSDVVIVARRVDRLEETRAAVEKTGRRCLAVPGDTSDPTTADRVVTAAMDEFGRVDVLVNNAGVGTAYPATREPPDEFRRVIDVNLNGCYWMAQACGRVMQPGSSIINISSVLGSMASGMPQAAYCASKAGVEGLTRDLAGQWTGRKGIRVNAIAPGFFWTEMSNEYPDGFVDQMVSARVPVGRVGDADEFTSAVIFLAGDAASYITGVVLPVDGGILIT